MRLPSRLPIIQAPMAGAQGPDMCIAVCKAGGLGSLPGAMVTPTVLREHIAAVRAQTDAPFNVNFFTHQPPPDDAAKEARWLERLAPYFAEAGIAPPTEKAPVRQPFGEEMCALIEETRPAVVSFHFGLPDEALFARVKATGAMTLSTATTVAEAKWLEARGVDAIVAQGREAGGHRGMFLSEDIDAQPGLFALLPQVTAAVRIPVIAAGGIATGQGVAAAFALGASAAQIGTAYLFTPEATITPLHRAALEEARDDATRLTNLYTGRPARSLVTRFMREQGPMNPAAPAFPLASRAAMPLRAAFEAKGADDFTPLWAGEAAGLAAEQIRMNSEQLTTELWEDARAAARHLGLRHAPACQAGEGFTLSLGQNVIGPYSKGDSYRFYGALSELPEYIGVELVGADLCLSLRKPLSFESFQELLALFRRYGLSLRLLRPALPALSQTEVDFLRQPDAIWFEPLFG